MKPIDFVTAMAILLSRPELQERFAYDAHQVADQLNLVDPDRSMFITLSPQQISTQANLLITKRLKEAYNFLPLTFTLIGKDGATYFTSYATTYWPHTHRRHVEDAFQFCHYLKIHHYPVNQSELNHLTFLRSGRRFSLALAKDALIRNHCRPAVQLFYRHNGTTGQWRLYLKG